MDWFAEFLPVEEVSRIESGFNLKPYRITEAHKELFSGYKISNAGDILTITEEIPNCNYNGLISGIGIPYLSFCEHHFLPFIGIVDVIYEPINIFWVLANYPD